MFGKVWSGLSAIALLAACGTGSPPVKVHRLPSGEEVRVLSLAKVTFAGSGPALMLKYQTDLSMDDTTALRAEARRIWAEFRKDAERAKVERAILSANSLPTGTIVRHSRTYNFVYQRNGSDTWSEVRKQ
jgi:hypothetical protein